MLNGAAHGAGIYLAEAASTSWSYSLAGSPNCPSILAIVQVPRLTAESSLHASGR